MCFGNDSHYGRSSDNIQRCAKGSNNQNRWHNSLPLLFCQQLGSRNEILTSSSAGAWSQASFAAQHRRLHNSAQNTSAKARSYDLSDTGRSAKTVRATQAAEVFTCRGSLLRSVQAAQGLLVQHSACTTHQKDQAISSVNCRGQTNAVCEANGPPRISADGVLCESNKATAEAANIRL